MCLAAIQRLADDPRPAGVKVLGAIASVLTTMLLDSGLNLVLVCPVILGVR